MEVMAVAVELTLVQLEAEAVAALAGLLLEAVALEVGAMEDHYLAHHNQDLQTMAVAVALLGKVQSQEMVVQELL